MYYPFINPVLIPYFKGVSDNTAKYMKDNGFERRVGSFAIWMDGEAEPLLAFPINLSVLLPTHDGSVGFVSATGSSWATFDILSWTFCETHNCA